MSSKNIILAGASPDTANLGVNALCHATAVKLAELNPAINITILDHGKDFRQNAYSLGEGVSCNVMGARLSKRYHEAASYKNIELLKYIPFVNTDQKSVFSTANAILDISGGDSFTDLYGEWRFKAIMYPKTLAKTYGKELILLPQTYGPFVSKEMERIASEAVKYAKYCFARDKYSFEFLKKLLGDSFDPARHLEAVDVAFLLPYSDEKVLNEKRILPKINEGVEVFGLNVSGLIYNDPAKAKQQYGIKIDYNELLKELVETILNESEGVVWLIPHVIAPKGHFESDVDACIALKEKLGSRYADRIHVVSGDYDQCDIKGVIRHCNWFCGTRMHSTIAALSSSVPTVGMAYSGKFQGVFESVGQGASVVDCRNGSYQQQLEDILNLWRKRNTTKSDLSAYIPQVVSRATEQFTLISQCISACS